MEEAHPPAEDMTTAAHSKNKVQLPTPTENPAADVVVYDGHCNFCTTQVQRLARWDTNARLAFLSLHDPQVVRFLPDLNHEQLMQQMFVVDQRGRRHAGAAAFRYLTTRLPKLYWLAPLMYIPATMPLWRWCYRQFAGRRYLFGKSAAACDDESCKLHTSSDP